MNEIHLKTTLAEDPSIEGEGSSGADVTWPSGGTATADGRPTSLLGGRFTVHRFLGEGGMGVVYAATDAALGQRVALKMLNGVGSQAGERMKWEFRALADVSHPNLVSLHELFCDEGRWFFTMELVVGRPLDEHLARAPTTDYGKITQTFAQLATGIGALHDAEKLHRDLKPSNVLVRNDGRVVILDFGLVEDIRGGEISQTGHGIVGTPAYMAPEQITGMSTAESDWYAFGVMLYEALSGALPFAGSVQEVFAAKCAGRPPPPPSSRRADIPRHLDELSALLLSWEPEKRPKRDDILAALGFSSGQSPISAPRSAESTPLVGRVAELSALRNAYAEVLSGEARAVLLHGASGIGKTTTVTHFLDEMQAQGTCVVLRGRCYERESVPYKAFDSILDALVRHLRRLPRNQVEPLTPRNVEALQLVFPVFRQVEAFVLPHHRRLPIDAHELRQAAFSALRETLARLADRMPVVLFIDDLQWGDPDSVQLLSALFGAPEPPAVLLVGCYREGKHGSGPLVEALRPGGELDAALKVRKLEVKELALDELTAVASAWVKDPELARRAAAEAQGSPLFAAELARHAKLSTVEQVTLQEVIRNRLVTLPSSARGLLDLIVVAGRPLALPVLGNAAFALLEGDTLDVYASVNMLKLQHLIRTSAAPETVVEPYHDRIADVVTTHLEEPRARACHLVLGEAFEKSGVVEPQILATHFHEARVSDKARRYAIAAADAAMGTLAFARAAHWYAIALELDAAQSDADDLRVKLADALAGGGLGAEAADQYLRVAERSRGQHALELRRRAADQLLRSGHFDRGFDVLHAVLSDVGLPRYRTTNSALPRLVKNRVLLKLKGYDVRRSDSAPTLSSTLLRVDACRVAANAFTRINFVIGSTYSAELLLLALSTGEPVRVAYGLCAEAMFLATEGAVARTRSIELVERASALAARTEDPALAGYLELARGCVELLTGHFPASITLLERAELTFRERCVGVAWEIGFARTLWIPAVQLHRSLFEPSPKIEEWLREARDSKNLEAIRQLLACHSYSYLASDRPEEAQKAVEEALRVWVPEELDTTGSYALFAETSRVHYVRAPRDEMRKHLSKFDAFFKSALSRCQFIRAHAQFYAACCELVLAIEEPASANKLVKSARDRAALLAREGVDYAEGFAHIVFAQLAHFRGDAAEAKHRLAEGVRSTTSSQQLVVAASCRYFHGVVAGGSEGAHEAAEALRDLAARGCARPDRIAAAYLPVFDRLA